MSFGAYALTVLVAARVVYWKVFDGDAMGDDAFAVFVISCIWPVMLVVWAVSSFITHPPRGGR
jgi:hypothetical protein